MHSRYLCGLEPAVTKDLCQFRIPFVLAWALSLVAFALASPLAMQTYVAAVDSVIASAASSSSSSSGFAAAHLLQTQK
jgi:hypothetical protein